jgi:hypothetical protein
MQRFTAAHQGLSMKRSHRCHSPGIILILLAVGLFAGCAAKQAGQAAAPQAVSPKTDRPETGTPPAAADESIESGVTMAYKMPVGTVMRYRSTIDFKETLSARGRARTQEMSRPMEFTMKVLEPADGNHRLGVHIDSLHGTLVMMGREMTREMGEVYEGGFEMVVTPWGEEISLPGAQDVRWRMGPADSQSVGPDFQAFFPDLPREPVEIGDSWTSEDTIVDESRPSPAMHLNNVHTFKGFETVDGVDCARITTVMKGEWGGEERFAQQNMFYEGVLFGTSTWYFAMEQGALIRANTRIRMIGQASLAGSREDVAPLEREINVEARLIP